MTASPKKVAKLSSLKSSLQKEREGDWIPAPDVAEGVKFLVRSTNYPAFVTARDEVNQRLARIYENERVPDEVLAEENGRLFADYLLLGWQGLDESYDADLARQVLIDIEHRAMRGGVLMAATRVGKSEVEFVEATSKN